MSHQSLKANPNEDPARTERGSGKIKSSEVNVRRRFRDQSLESREAMSEILIAANRLAATLYEALMLDTSEKCHELRSWLESKSVDQEVLERSIMAQIYLFLYISANPAEPELSAEIVDYLRLALPFLGLYQLEAEYQIREALGELLKESKR